MSQIEVNEMLGLVCHIAAKVPANNAMPNGKSLTWKYRFCTILPFSSRVAANFAIKEEINNTQALNLQGFHQNMESTL